MTHKPAQAYLVTNALFGGFLRLLAPFCLFFLLCSLPVQAQTPPCSTSTHAGASYDNCIAGQCERMVCNGSAYVPLGVWSHEAWEAVQIGNDTSACNATRQGRLRYRGGTNWEYCDGASWVGW
jgi:hypothetical protein